MHPTDKPLRDAAYRLLFDRIDYERAPSMAYEDEALKLDRMRSLLDRLRNPQENLKIVHIAGTKGKGSTAAMIAAVITAAGNRAGLFTSPHLERVEERIVVDGQPIDTDAFVALIESVRPEVEAFDREALAAGRQGATYFELITALALMHFARCHADAVVLEVGMGGRLDATNVCRPVLAVVTNISLDHTKQLGSTLAAIAREKAGIIKQGVPVISGAIAPEPHAVIREVCRQRHCRLIELGDDFAFRYRPPRRLDLAPALGELAFVRKSPSGDLQEMFPLAMPGAHQAANAALAIRAVDELRRLGWDLPSAAVRKALGELSFPARVEVVARRPTIILDAAHNTASVAALLATLEESFEARRQFLVFATTQEKDLAGMLALLLPKFDEVILTRYLDNPRYVPLAELAAAAEQVSGRRYRTAADPAAAWRMVREEAGPEDLICITGSFFLAAQIRRAM